MVPTPNFTVNLRLRKDKWSSVKQAYPIYLRIKFPRQPETFKQTHVYIKDLAHWNSETEKVTLDQNKVYKNKMLSDQKNELETMLLEHAASKRVLTKATLKRKEITSFYAYIKEIMSHKKATTEIGRIKRYFKREPNLHEIDYEWLRKYQKHQENIWEDAPETIKGTFKVLRKVTNQAWHEGYLTKHVIGEGAYPVPEGGSELPVFLVKEERETILNAWANGEIKDPSLYQSLTYFLLGCYAGLRFGDLEEFDIKTKVVGENLAFKARKNDNIVSYPVTKTIDTILAVIRKIGPLNQSYDLYNNKNLKLLQAFFQQDKYGIDKEWGKSHRARHSFGRLMAENGVTLDDCAHFMGISKKTAEVYYHLSGKIVTDRNEHLRAI